MEREVVLLSIRSNEIWATIPILSALVTGVAGAVYQA
jgi:hypothetical protein